MTPIARHLRSSTSAKPSWRRRCSDPTSIGAGSSWRSIACRSTNSCIWPLPMNWVMRYAMRSMSSRQSRMPINYATRAGSFAGNPSRLHSAEMRHEMPRIRGGYGDIACDLRGPREPPDAAGRPEEGVPAQNQSERCLGCEFRPDVRVRRGGMDCADRRPFEASLMPWNTPRVRVPIRGTVYYVSCRFEQRSRDWRGTLFKLSKTAT